MFYKKKDLVGHARGHAGAPDLHQRRRLPILSEQALEERGVEIRKDTGIDGLEGHRIMHALTRHRAVSVIGLVIELRLRGLAGGPAHQRGTDLTADILSCR